MHDIATDYLTSSGYLPLLTCPEGILTLRGDKDLVFFAVTESGPNDQFPELTQAHHDTAAVFGASDIQHLAILHHNERQLVCHQPSLLTAILPKEGGDD